MKKVRQLATYLWNHSYNVAQAVSIFCLLVLVPIVTSDVIGRYVFNRPLPKGFADQFGAYLLVWMGFLALAFTLKTGGHIRVEIVTSRLPQRVRQLLEVVTYVLSVPVWGVITWKTTALVVESVEHHTIAYETLPVVVWPIQIAMPVGMGMLLISLILELYKKIKTVRLRGASEPKGK